MNHLILNVTYCSNVLLLHVTLVVQPARLLLLADIYPVVEADDGAVFDLVDKDMLESRAANLSLPPRILGEPEFLDQVPVGLRIGADQTLLLEELHGLSHHRSGHHGVQEVVFFLTFIRCHMLIDQRVSLIVVEQDPHLGNGRGVQGLGIHTEKAKEQNVIICGDIARSFCLRIGSLIGAVNGSRASLEVNLNVS